MNQRDIVDYGGDSSAVASELKQVQAICGSAGAFAALKKDGTVASWGSKGHHTLVVIKQCFKKKVTFSRSLPAARRIPADFEK